MACVNVIAAEDSDQAKLMSTSLQKIFMGIVTNKRSPPQPPDPDFVLPPHIAQALDSFLSCSFIGDAKEVKEGISDFVESTAIDEIMVTSHIYNFEDRVNSYRILKEIQESA